MDQQTSAQPSITDISSQPFTHLVLSGGAYLGFAELGALSALSDTIDPTQMKTYDATSIGCIFSVLFALGCSTQDVMEYFLERPWEQVIHELYPNISIDTVSRVIEQGGIFDKEFTRIVMHPFLSIHFPEHVASHFENLTLQEVYEYTGKEIYMYAVRLPCDSTMLELASISHYTHPDMPLLTALQMTTAVPILFEPVEYKGDTYIDGGLLSNYPIQQCVERGVDVDSIFSIYLKTLPTDSTPSKYKLFEFQYGLLYRMVYRLRGLHENVSVPNELIVLCEHMSLDEIWTQIRSKEARRKMMDIGERSALLYKEYKTRQSLSRS